MMTASLWLLGAALSLATVALTIAIILDRREQDRQSRLRGSRIDSSSTVQRPTVVEWTHSLVLGSDEPSASQARPDIIIGPWTSSSVNIEDEPRKAA